MPEEFESEEYMDFEKLKSKVKHFVRERDWEKYRTPKDIAIDIAVEAGELLEIFQWMKDSEMDKIKENEQLMARIKSEVADVISACLNMANALDLDVADMVLAKLKKDEKRYPINEFRGSRRNPSE